MEYSDCWYIRLKLVGVWWQRTVVYPRKPLAALLSKGSSGYSVKMVMSREELF